MAADLLRLYGLREGPSDDDDDAELDVKTSPFRSFSNPFDAKPPGKVAGSQKHGVGPIATSTPKPQMAPPAPKPFKPNDMSATNVQPTSPVGAPEPKPSYKGSFVGQVHNPGGTYQPKMAAWQTPGPSGPEWRRRSVQGLQKGRGFVWDGQDWVTPDVFDLKVKSKPGSQSSISKAYSFPPKKP